LLDAGDSVSELPLPVIPQAVWSISKEPVSGSGYLTWRFLLRVIGDAALAWGLLRVVAGMTVQTAFL
jgi:hypothetical protein